MSTQGMLVDSDKIKAVLQKNICVYMLLIKDHVANLAGNSSLAQNTCEPETERFLDARQTWTDKCCIEMCV